MEWLITTINAVLMSPTWLFCLYWLPLMISGVGYTIKTIKQTKKDAANRDKDPEHYYPTVTLGTILGRLFLVTCPVVNFFNALFFHVFQIASQVVDFLAEVFNQPLVPKHKK